MIEKYTVKELSEILGISTTATYKKVERKGLKTLKEMVGSREITFISLDKSELDTLRNESDVNKEFTRVNSKPFRGEFETVERPPVKESSSDVNINEVINSITTLQNQVLNQAERIEKYAFDAGQTKLLTVNLDEEKKRAKQFEEEYFKLKYEAEAKDNKIKQFESEIEVLNNRCKVLETNNEEFKTELQDAENTINQLQLDKDDLSKKLETERKRPFWQRNVL